jgi:two-component system invasion response regulator UvrY
MTRILITDDHAIVRQGLKQILAEEIMDATFGEAGNSAEAVALLHKEAWDVLILDINMPGRNGFEVLADVRLNFPRLPILVLSSTPEDQLGVRALRSGAAGYLNKQAAPEQLVNALRTVLTGGQFISGALSQKIVAALRRDSGRPKHEALSDRELQVFKLTVSAMSLKEIAVELSLSAKTISTFRVRIFQKLAVKSDIELMRYAQEHGFL